MRVLVSGASGFVGSELTRQLAADGHRVLTLVRRAPRGPSEFSWSPAARVLDFSLLGSVDAVVNLSGAPLTRLPWTRRYRRVLLESRLRATQALTEAMNMVAKPPTVFISASAVGFYGDRPGERLTEESSKGTGFMPDLVDAWERAARLAPEQTRVVSVRSALVIGPGGGSLRPLLTLARAGLGVRVGGGGQHWPWISLRDEVAAIRHLLTSDLVGPVNLAGPRPATSDRVTAAIGGGARRIPVPERLIAGIAGSAGRELALASQKVLPTRLIADGFRFRDETVDQAVRAALAE